MKNVLLTCALLMASPVSFCQEPVKGKDGKILLEIHAKEGLSYEGAQKQVICELTEPTVTLFRSDKKGGKIKGMTLKANHCKAETSAGGGGGGRYLLSGNVRAGQEDGSVINAKEAVIDLAEETVSFKMDIGIEIPKK